MPRLPILAAALVLATSAFAGDRVVLWKNTGTLFDTTFDLGFDVSGIPHDPAETKAFLLLLDPAHQVQVVNACGYFVRYPYMAQSPETRGFCGNLYR
jgi:hypothetical protein